MTVLRNRRVIGMLSVCVFDASGQIVREAKVASEPEALIGWFRYPGLRRRGSGSRRAPCRNGCTED